MSRMYTYWNDVGDEPAIMYVPRFVNQALDSEENYVLASATLTAGMTAL